MGNRVSSYRWELRGCKRDSLEQGFGWAQCVSLSTRILTDGLRPGRPANCSGSDRFCPQEPGPAAAVQTVSSKNQWVFSWKLDSAPQEEGLGLGLLGPRPLSLTSLACDPDVDSCLLFCRGLRLWTPLLHDVGAPESRVWGSGWLLHSSGLPFMDGSPKDALGPLAGLTARTPASLGVGRFVLGDAVLGVSTGRTCRVRVPERPTRHLQSLCISQPVAPSGCFFLP